MLVMIQRKTLFPISMECLMNSFNYLYSLNNFFHPKKQSSKEFCQSKCSCLPPLYLTSLLTTVGQHSHLILWHLNNHLKKKFGKKMDHVTYFEKFKIDLGLKYYYVLDCQPIANIWQNQHRGFSSRFRCALSSTKVLVILPFIRPT